MKTINKHQLCIFMVCLILITLGLIISSITNDSIIILIYIDLIFIFYAFLYFKYSIYSLIILLSNYPIFPLIYAFYFNKGASSLGLNTLEIHIQKILITILIFNIITIIFVHTTKVLKSEKRLLKSSYNISKPEIFLFTCIVILYIAILLPHIPFIDPNRSDALLKGGAWNYTGLCAFAFLTAKGFKENKLATILFFVIILWNIGNYARADVVGLIVFYFVRYIVLNRLPTYKKVRYFTMLLVIFLFAIFVGEYRVSTNFNNNIFVSFVNSFGSLVQDVLNQPTAADIIHIYNVGIDYVQNVGLLHGSTYKFYIYSFVPFLGQYYADSNLFTNVLSNYYFNRGGGFFLTEPYLNFGIWGVMLYTIAFNIVLYIILKKNNLQNYIYYVCTWIVVFRLQWYGLIYIERSFLQIIPLYLIIHAIFIFKNKAAFKPLNKLNSNSQ